MTTATGHIHALPAYPAEAFRVETGANMGDSLGVLDDLVLDDTYLLHPGAEPARLALEARPDGSFAIAAASAPVKRRPDSSRSSAFA